VRAFASELERLRSASVAASGAVHPRLASLSRFLSLFPALVVPLELREEAGAFRPGSPIAGMMRRVAALSRGGEARGYVRGLVVSMVSEAAHLLQAHRLARRCVPEGLPVVPLFERPADLENAPAVLAAAFRDRAFARDARERRHGPPEARGLLEVMVGYSDTAKRMGALASRLAIHDAMLRVGRWAASKRVPLLFFHGAGGSEGRGGGTIEEQAALWPAGSLAQVKVTIQGEMVERTFSTPEILKSQVLHWARVQHAPPKARPPGALTRTLAKLAHEAFADIVQRPSFTELLDRATPYRALGELHIGSRPSRRSPLAEFGDRGSRISGRAGALAEIEGLRAIPWVMCWTQSRLLLPAWLGLGRAWREAGRGVSSKALATALETDPMLRSYLRTLRFALAKEAPRIWLEYVRRLAPGADEALLGSLERERSLALDLARRASGARWVRGPRARGLLPDRPWLAESIFYRAPMIHPLNLLQIGTLSRPRPGPDDLRLLRETVTGIAAGMLTTG
jgi:phosphoenolpyruvate carboxylase